MAWIVHEYLHEYRINKNGCECYRTPDLDQLRAKLAELRSKRPGTIYAAQSRDVRIDNGRMICDYKGRPAWSVWQDWGI